MIWDDKLAKAPQNTEKTLPWSSLFLERKKVEKKWSWYTVRDGPGTVPAECAEAPELDFVDLGSWSQHAQLHPKGMGGGFNRFAHSAGPNDGTSR